MNLKLNSDKLSRLKGMSLYWEEISKRDENKDAAYMEISSVRSILTNMEILQMIAEGLKSFDVVTVNKKPVPPYMKMVTAKFIGSDGSLGYKTNETYQLLVDGLKISRWETHQGQCAYDSIESFLDNWTEINCVSS